MTNHPFRRLTTLRLSVLASLTLLVLVALAAQPLAADAHLNSRFIASAARVIPRPLSLAAAHSIRADRAFVADARALKLCLSRHPAQCAATRRTLQQAGGRSANAKRKLAQAARASASSLGTARASRAWTQRAAQVSVTGRSLRWTRIARVNNYVVETKVPGQAPQYAVVHGASTTPPPVPGATVRYRVRTAISRSSWSLPAAIAYPLPDGAGSPTPAPGAPGAGETVDTQAAPALAVAGQTLSWNQVGSVSTYVLVQRLAGHADQYSVVGGTSFTPTPVPGATVHYSVRTAVEGSAWAPEVSIAFPSAPPVGGESPSTPPSESPSGGSFEMGMVPESLDSSEPGMIHAIGARSVRMEKEIGAPASDGSGRVEEYARAGIRIMPLAGFEGKLPTSEQAKNLGTWAAAYGPGGTFWQGKSEPAGTAMTTIEFGNETSYAYQFSDTSDSAVASRAQTYAIRFKEAYEAIHAANPNVGLLAQADDGDSGNSIWVENMFKAVPNLGQMVAGWTVHPYGPEWKGRLDALVSQTQAAGASSSIPIYVTEWGLATDNGRCLSDNYGWNKCMSYSEAASALGSTVTGMRARYGARLRGFYLYQAQDQSASGTSSDREQYFGAMQSNGEPKGAYTSEVDSLFSQFG